MPPAAPVYGGPAKSEWSAQGLGAGFCSAELKERHPKDPYTDPTKPLLQYLRVCGLAGTVEEGCATARSWDGCSRRAQELNLIYCGGERQIKAYDYTVVGMGRHFGEGTKLPNDWVPAVHMPARVVEGAVAGAAMRLTGDATPDWLAVQADHAPKPVPADVTIQRYDVTADWYDVDMFCVGASPPATYEEASSSSSARAPPKRRGVRTRRSTSGSNGRMARITTHSGFRG